METNYLEKEVAKTSFENAIISSSDVETDTMWALLKYKQIGIYRKVGCICNLLDLNFDSTIKTLPQDDKGRILDYKTRHLIHDSLLRSS